MGGLLSNLSRQQHLNLPSIALLVGFYYGNRYRFGGQKAERNKSIHSHQRIKLPASLGKWHQLNFWFTHYNFFFLLGAAHVVLLFRRTHAWESNDKGLQVAAGGFYNWVANRCGGPHIPFLAWILNRMVSSWKIKVGILWGTKLKIKKYYLNWPLM